ncbi:MAG: hypothetical protein LBQ01_05240 [Prevotellaceae bacterium]|nr:hypothetical protein [Prevotellaceae bacterium]
MKSLRENRVPVDYLHDSKIADCDRSDGIALTAFDGHAFDTDLSVTKINGEVFPFLFYNYIEKNFAVKLGQMSLDRDYSDFFKESFAIESGRTGCYSLVDEPAENDYTLEIVYDTCITVSKYHQNTTIIFLIFTYSIYSQEVGFPAQTDLSVHVTLRKGDEIILDNKYFINKTLPPIPSDNMNINKMRFDFVSNMAESLSLGTKECIEQIIDDINSGIRKN